MWFLLKISVPHAVRHLPRTVLTIIGIAAGVAAILATQVVTASTLLGLSDLIRATAGDAQLHVVNGSAGVPEDVAERVRHVRGVAAVAPYVEGVIHRRRSGTDTLTLFGVDLFGDRPWAQQIPRAAVSIPDEMAFAASPDSILLSHSYAERERLRVGDTLDVVTANGARALTLRGFVESEALDALFDGRVAVMDLPHAQALLAKTGKADRLDVYVLRNAPIDRVKETVARLLAGTGRVAETSLYGRSTGDLLFSMRVVLALASVIAIVVAFFIIYHTVLVSIAQRRREIVLLRTLGVSAARVVVALLVEAAVFGVAAVTIGLAAGLVLAKTSLAAFGDLTAAWVRLPRAEMDVQVVDVLLAGGVGMIVSITATAVALRPALSSELAAADRGTSAGTRNGPLIASAAAGGLLLVVAALLIAAAPRSLPFLPLVAYVLTANGALLVGFGLLAPLLCGLCARIVLRTLDPATFFPGRFAAGVVAQDPTTSVAVVVAIVMALGATLADASLIASVKTSWLGWMDEYVRCDVVVTAEGGIDDLLTLEPISEDVMPRMRDLPGARAVHGIRVVQSEYRDHPIVVEGIDEAPLDYPLPRRDWSEIEERFRSGKGVIVSENLAWWADLHPGQLLTLSTPSGAREFEVLASFPDALAGDLGSVAMDRQVFRSLWRDTMVSRIHVWASAPEAVEPLRAAIQERFGESFGLRALTVAEARAAVADLIERAFSSAYALLAVAVSVSFIGIVNFLLAASLDRQAWLQTLYGIGLSKAQLAWALIAEGVLIGTVGIAVGVLAGAAVSSVIVGHSIPMVNGWHFTYVFPAAHALLLSFAALVLAMTAGLFPAWLATRDGYLLRGAP